MKIALIAGEVSGDMLAAELVAAIRISHPEAEFIGVTGEKMRASQVRSLADINELSLHGLLEIIPALPRLWRFRRKLQKTLIAESPDLIIGVDAPEFNLRFLQSLRERGFRTWQFVCPTIWAWRANRVHRLKKAVSLVICLYPFEQQILAQHGIPHLLFGHPLAQNIPLEDQTMAQRELLARQADEFIVTLLPGSRPSEIARHAALILECAWKIHHQWRIRKRSEKLSFIVPIATRETLWDFEMAQYQWKQKHPDQILPPIQIMRGHAPSAIAISNFCLAASGTVTLEIALYHKPMIIFYRMNPLSLWLVRRLYRLAWFGLPNILTQSSLVREFLQDDACAENICEAFFAQINDRQQSAQTHQQMMALHRSLRIQPQEDLTKWLEEPRFSS